MEFVAKPTRISGAGDLQPIRDDLLTKLRMVRSLSLETLAARTRTQRLQPPNTAGGTRPALSEDLLGVLRSSGENNFLPARLLCIGASTGGPPSILALLQNLDPRLPVTILITQHMPEMYTHAFAERLRRATQWPVRTPTPGEAVAQGEVLVASGNSSLCVVREGPFLCVSPPLAPEDRQTAFVPSIDRMLAAAAEAMSDKVVAVLLSGMSGEGVSGIHSVRAAGGRVLVESPESAIMTGMPQEAIRSGAVHEVVPLRRMAETLTRLILTRR
jgi:two-component system chemotaxis response regulator CheB